MRRFWFILFIYSIGSAEEKADSLGNKLPLTPNRNIAFETSEGTWMSLDVSPDGRFIIFDLVGDIYTIPFRGGQATRVTSGIGFDSQPVYSPDGETAAVQKTYGLQMQTVGIQSN